jgi:hypothetical protein
VAYERVKPTYFKTFHHPGITKIEYFVLFAAIKNFKKKRVIVSEMTLLSLNFTISVI